MDLDALRAAIMTDGRKQRPAKTKRQRNSEEYNRRKERNPKYIAVLDMETDPFDADRPAEAIHPFVAMLYCEQFEPITIWEEDFPTFCTRVIEMIEGLPNEYVIFAHNGGKFDWQFILHRLRGAVSFKGRGIMSAKIGRHSIRDSFHLLPEKLAAYRKDEFDYKKLLKHRRNNHRPEILSYLEADCRYLYELLAHFTGEHGIKLSIGQAAMAAVKAAGYEIENLGEGSDAFFRNYFFGGRVECIKGKGEFTGPFKLYDVNSMYPDAMANNLHPVGRAFEIHTGQPTDNTIFLDLTCTNHGALVARGPDGETSPLNGRHRFKTTIHEYKVALKYKLIENVEIHGCIDFEDLSNFERFVCPRYERRQTLKREIADFREALQGDSEECMLAIRNDLTEKYLLNNSYGKNAQNPRKYKESYITTWGMRPPSAHQLWIDKEAGEWDPKGATELEMELSELEWDALPAVENKALGYAIWEKPAQRLRFRNVATAASITGAARAKLLEAMVNAVDPIYCDTDSLICRELNNHDLDKSRLGAWDLEATFERVIIAGKKTYACDQGAHVAKGRFKIRSKGTSGLTWDNMAALLDRELGELVKRNPAPTLSRDGKQVYIQRRIRATAGRPNAALLKKARAIA